MKLELEFVSFRYEGQIKKALRFKGTDIYLASDSTQGTIDDMIKASSIWAEYASAEGIKKKYKWLESYNIEEVDETAKEERPLVPDQFKLEDTVCNTVKIEVSDDIYVVIFTDSIYIGKGEEEFEVRF